MEQKKASTTLYNQHAWNVIAIAGFLTAISALVVFWGETLYAPVVYILNSPFTFLILVLATYRLTRLIVADRVTQWMRDLCVRVTVLKDPVSGEERVIRTQLRKGPRRLFSDLFSCAWCSGVWAAFLVLALYVWSGTTGTLAGWVVILILALAGAGSIFQASVGALIVGGKETMKSTPETPHKHIPGGGEHANVCLDCGIDV